MVPLSSPNFLRFFELSGLLLTTGAAVAVAVGIPRCFGGGSEALHFVSECLLSRLTAALLPLSAVGAASQRCLQLPRLQLREIARRLVFQLQTRAPRFAGPYRAINSHSAAAGLLSQRVLFSPGYSSWQVTLVGSEGGVCDPDRPSPPRPPSGARRTTVSSTPDVSC